MVPIGLGKRSSRWLLPVAIAFASLVPIAAQATPPADHNVQSLPLQNTQWNLIALNGNPVPQDGFEPQLVLRQTKVLYGDSIGNLSLSESPNELTGSYETSSNSLHMHMVTSTLVAVQVPHTEVKPGSTPPPPPKSFIDAIHATSSFRIHGATLELLDQNGVVLARLAATKNQSS
jgi:heat shock protein HslJ